MYGDFGRGLNSLFKTMAILLAVSLPLGLWKLIEIAVWFFGHLHWGKP